MGVRADLIIALVAAGLALLAFVVAGLQMIMQYVTSTSSREKCSTAAIGPSHHQVTWKFSIKTWKIRFFYPLLDFDCGGILLFMLASERRNLDNDKIIKLMKTRLQPLEKGGWAFRPVKPKDVLTRWHVADDLVVLVDNDRADRQRGSKVIHFRDLDFRAKLAFLWWRFRHPLHPVQRPRSSWAQMLIALGLRETRFMQLGLADADSVHDNLDTGIQRVKFRDLGFLALVMGFKSINIDISNRSFRALSPLGSITTEEVQVVGKVLRFEGDILAFRALIGRCEPLYIFRARSLIEGQISFGKFLSSGLFFSLIVLSRAISMNLPTGVFDDEARNFVIKHNRRFVAGPVYQEASIMKKYLEDLYQRHFTDQSGLVHESQEGLTRPPEKHNYTSFDEQMNQFLLLDHEKKENALFEDCMKHWQVKTGSTMPTLYVAASFLTLHAVICGFPSKTLLYPLVPWIRRRAKVLFQRRDQTWRISQNLQDDVIKGRLGFAREDSEFLMTTGLGASDQGSFGWGITRMRAIWDSIPSKLQREIVNDDAQDDGKWDANGVLTIDTALLLKKFEIRKWSTTVLDYAHTSVAGFNDINLIWIQVVILDIAIQFLIRGSWSFEPMRDTEKEEEEKQELHSAWRKGGLNKHLGRLIRTHNPFFDEAWGSKEASVVTSIVNAWRPQDRTGVEQPAVLADYEEAEIEADDENDDWTGMGVHLRDWDLGPALIENRTITFGKCSSAERENKCRKLADLLEIRAIFVLALLLMHPDSSDIYNIPSSQDIEMPIA